MSYSFHTILQAEARKKFSSKFALVAAWLLGLLVCLWFWPQPIVAQTSANTGAEIIFMDENGFIRVLDTRQLTDRPRVEWVSPTAGWTDFAVGDVNNDGDAEIVAIGGGATTGKLAVYDPVVTSGPTNPNNVINGIPWATLYETMLPGEPTIVAVGKFNPYVTGNGIVYGYRLNAADRLDPNRVFRLVVLQPGSAQPDGRSWQPQITPYDFEETWTQLVAADIDDHPGADLVLIGERSDSSILAIYRIQQSLERIYDNEDSHRTWYSTAVGRFHATSVGLQVAMAREGQLGLPSIFVSRYSNDVPSNFKDVYAEYFAPAPQNLFLGDVNASGDDELFVLRSVPATITNAPHFFMINDGKDKPIPVNLRLDTDNGFRVGVAGDLDGDGRADVVIMRSNRIRIYPNIARVLSYSEYNFNTNCPIPGVTVPAANSGRCSLKIAELDKSGFVHTPVLSATPTAVAGTIAAGLSGQLQTITLTNVGTSANVPFAVEIEDTPGWVAVSPTTGQTPATLTFSFDARTLGAGQYTAKLLVRPTDETLSFTPFTLDVVLTVTSGLAARPAESLLTVYPCTSSPTIFSYSVYLDGPTGQLFTVQLLPGTANATEQSAAAAPVAVTTVPWATPPSLLNTLPTTVTFTIDPSKRTSDFEKAYLHVETTDSQQPTVAIKRDFPFDLLCANTQTYLPIVGR